MRNLIAANGGLGANTPVSASNPFGSGLTPPNSSGGISNIDTTTPLTSLELLVSNIIGLITTIGALIFVFMFFIGALKWITGGDDSSKVQKARDQMIQGVIGLVIMVAAYAIIGLIGSIIGLNILSPAAQVRTILGITGY